ncbi:hypothetical protein V8C35DRAFT_282360 [Trichoderma chlorosporum]
MSSHNRGSHKPDESDPSTNDHANSGVPLTAALLAEVPEDDDYSINRFLSQASTERPPLGFREAETEEQARERLKAQLDTVDKLFDLSKQSSRK